MYNLNLTPSELVQGQNVTVGNLELEIIKELNAGAEGSTYQAEVKNVTPPSSLHIGEEVILKRQQAPNSTSYLQKIKDEMEVLAKERTLLSSQQTTANDRLVTDMVLPLFPGKGLDAIYNDLHDAASTAEESISSFEDNQRNNIAYSLIRDHFAHQLLGIVHCDLKADNIICDPESGTAKIIDFGIAYLLQNGAQFKKLSTASKYAPPDLGPNNPKTEEYTLGLIIAELYAPRRYINDEFNDAYYALRHQMFPSVVGYLSAEQRQAVQLATIQQLMNDVIGETKPPNMPDDIYQIIRHLTKENPAQRPENLALAQGVKDSPNLQDLRKVQIDAEKLRDSLRDSVVPLVNNLSKRNFKSFGQQLEFQQALKKLSSLAQSGDKEKFNQELMRYSKSNELSRRDKRALGKLAKSEISMNEKINKLHYHVKKDKNYFIAKMYDVINSSHDMMTIQAQLFNLKQEIPNKKSMREIHGEIDFALFHLSDFSNEQAKKIQAVRVEAISHNNLKQNISSEISVETVSPSDSYELILKDLKSLADKHRIPPAKDNSLTFSYASSYRYDDVGKLINNAANMIAEGASPELMRLQLTQLARNLSTHGQQDSDQIKQLISRMDDIAPSGDLKKTNRGLIQKL